MNRFRTTKISWAIFCSLFNSVNKPTLEFKSSLKFSFFFFLQSFKFHYFCLIFVVFGGYFKSVTQYLKNNERTVRKNKIKHEFSNRKIIYQRLSIKKKQYLRHLFIYINWKRPREVLLFLKIRPKFKPKLFIKETL